MFVQTSSSGLTENEVMWTIRTTTSVSKPTVTNTDFVADKYTFSQTSWGTKNYTGYFNIKYTNTHLTPSI